MLPAGRPGPARPSPHSHALSGQVARVGPEQSATDDHDAVTRPGIVAVSGLAPGSAPSPSPGHGLAGAQAKAAVWGDRRRTACQAAHGGAREAASLLGASTEGRAWGDGAVRTRARPGRGGAARRSLCFLRRRWRRPASLRAPRAAGRPGSPARLPSSCWRTPRRRSWRGRPMRLLPDQGCSGEGADDCAAGDQPGLQAHDPLRGRGRLCPPPRSIKSQVMDGSLLSATTARPRRHRFHQPPLHWAKYALSGKAFEEANMKKLLKSRSRTGAARAAAAGNGGSGFVHPAGDTIPGRHGKNCCGTHRPRHRRAAART